MTTASHAQARPAALVREWIGPTLLAAALSALWIAFGPHVRDLANAEFRAWLVERDGLVLWSNAWYGGHYTFSYSVLSPALGALLGVRAAGALAAVAATFCFDRLAHRQWPGPGATLGSWWFAAATLTVLLSGRMAFMLGVALGLAALLALLRSRPALAVAAALATALASPVAALFLALVVLVAPLGRSRWPPPTMVATALAAVVPAALLALAFPDGGHHAFVMSSYLPVPLFCAAAILTTSTLPSERPLRYVLAAYALLATLAALVPTPLGGNAVRLGVLFGGPVLACVLVGRDALKRWVLVISLVLLATWQLPPALRDAGDAAGDRAAQAAYYRPLLAELVRLGATRERVQVVETLNHREADTVARKLPLAGGFYTQLAERRNALFYAGRLTQSRYRAWLERNGVRFVALSRARLDPHARQEGRLVRSGLPFLRPAAHLADWRIYEVPSARAMVVRGEDPPRRGRAGGAVLASLGIDTFGLDVDTPGSFIVRVHYSPYWKVTAGQACITRAPHDWTRVSTHRRGRVAVAARLSVGRAWHAILGDGGSCS